MTDLARELGKIAPWVRLHYVYPYPHVDQVIPLMAEGLVLPYLDIPFQHASPTVLKAMRARPTRRRCWSASATGARSAPTSRSARPSSSASPARPRRISNICSTGSTRRSSTASAPSASSRSRAPPPTPCPTRCPKRSRKSATPASWRRPPRSPPPSSRAKIGRTLDVIIDAVDADGGATGRSKADAPEIDGEVHLRDAGASGAGRHRRGRDRGCRRARPVRGAGREVTSRGKLCLG